MDKERLQARTGLKCLVGLISSSNDEKAIEEEFGDAGLFEVTTIAENYPFYVITCRKHKMK